MPKTKEEQNGHTETFWIRVDSIVQLILSNDKYLMSKRQGELLKQIEKKFDIDNPQAYKYLSEAKKQIRKLTRVKRDEAFKQAIRDREWLIQSAKNEKEKKRDILAMMQDRDKLFGLYVDESKQDITVSLKDVNLKSLADDQLVRLKEMLSKGIELRDALLHIGVIIK